MNRASEVFDRLLERFGPQHWWPADTPFEMMVGAILTPQTSWKKVEVAIANLKRAGLLSPAKIARAPLGEIIRLVKPAGLYRTKPRRLKELSRHIVETSAGDVGAFLRRDARTLGEDLLSMDGIGPETADSILLYAAGKAVFVVDAYTRRVGNRVGLFDRQDYLGIQSYFERNVRRDVKLYQEYHALIVELAKRNCRPRPICGSCPLVEICDHGRSEGLVDVSGHGK